MRATLPESGAIPTISVNGEPTALTANGLGDDPDGPRAALLICYGVGNTARSLLSHRGLRRLDVVDLLQQAVWGQGFPAPTFSEPLEVISQRLVGERHLKLAVRHGGALRRAQQHGARDPCAHAWGRRPRSLPRLRGLRDRRIARDVRARGVLKRAVAAPGGWGTLHASH